MRKYSEILENIFEPYSSLKEAQHGIGLGLYLLKKIIEKKSKVLS